MITELAFPNSATVRTAERTVLRGGRLASIALPVRYVRFRHERAGQCLVDTGYTSRVTTGERSFALRLYARSIRPRLTSQAMVGAAKIDLVILTHLHADHVSGLRDLGDARIITDDPSAERLLSLSRLGQLRFGLFAELLPEGFLDRIEPFSAFGEVDTPLGAGRDLMGDRSVVAVPLPGHMDGHHGVLFATPDGPLLYAADAQWLGRAVREDRLPAGPAAWITHDRDLARETAGRIAAFERSGGRVIYCHDPAPLP